MDSSKVKIEDLASVSDLAGLLGVGPSAISNYRRRHESFPKPVTVVACGTTPLFDRREVVCWWGRRVNPELLRLLAEVK